MSSEICFHEAEGWFCLAASKRRSSLGERLNIAAPSLSSSVNVVCLQSQAQHILVPMQADEQTTVIKTFPLQNTRIVIDKKESLHSLAIREQAPSVSDQKPNLLAIELEMTVREPLNECLKSRAQILQVGLKSLQIEVVLITRQGEYCFEEMNYYMFLEAHSSRHGDECSLKVTQVKQDFKSTTLRVVLYLSRNRNVLEEAESLQEIYLLAGSNEFARTFCFEISYFRLQTMLSSDLPRVEDSLPNRFKFIDGEHSLPAGVFSHPSQIYSSLNIRQNCTLEDIQAMIGALPLHEAPPQENETKLYICHDMQGGYQQDLFLDHNSPSVVAGKSPAKGQMAYRCLHLEQSDVFNYFSHHNITVPPRHWRILCRRYGTRCLGTFITEGEDYSENMLTSKQFALLLVGLARKGGFDGYLLNIQRKVSTVTAFKKWVEYFTLKMHQFVPNSMVVWYDSILATSGELRHQNALTRDNYEFFHFTDAFFTNYWWNPSSLQATAQLRGTNQRRVYVGNDCFGRGTFGGGRLEIYKGANPILEFKGQLGIGLFAPGFTYEEGRGVRALFHIMENSLYKGINTQFLEMEKWKEKKRDQTNGGWEKQGNQLVASFGHCQRSVTLKFQPLKDNQDIRIVFFCQVASTPPLVGSPYKIVLQIVDENKQVLQESDTYNFFNCKVSQQDPVQASEEIIASFSNLGARDLSVRVILMAQSKQKWAGFHGPRFSNEMVSIQTYEKQRHWISKVPIRQHQLGQPYHSYCNTGFGDFFYAEGLPLQPSYDFLGDMDVPHTHIINNPLDLEWDYEHCFFGGSSLKIKKETIKLMKIVIPQGLDPKAEYYLQVTVQHTQGVSIACRYISKNEEDRVFAAKLVGSEEVNSWKKYTFRLVSSLQEVKATTRSMLELTSLKWPFWLGEIKLVCSKDSHYNPIKCRLTVSKDLLPSHRYYLHLTISSEQYHRLYVQIQEVGMFAYFSAGRAILRNIPIRKCEQLELQIVDTDGCLNNTPLCLKTLDAVSISSLILKGYLQF